MKTFADIIGLWPTAEALAADTGDSGITVRAWRNRNSIPAHRWLDVVRAAERRGLDVTLAVLAAAAAEKGRVPAPTTPSEPEAA